MKCMINGNRVGVVWLSGRAWVYRSDGLGSNPGGAEHLSAAKFVFAPVQATLLRII